MKQTVLDPMLSERRGPCLVLTLNVPAERNILSPEVYEGLHRGLDAALADPEIANVILTGAGGFFCAGGDLNALATRSALPLSGRGERIEPLHRLVRRIRGFARPVIAAVEGGTAGAEPQLPWPPI